MSRFLKFIIHFVIIVAIICSLALTLPSFFGVTTFVVESADQTTNLPVGSVTYAYPAKVTEAVSGDLILVNDEDATYKYQLYNISPESGTATVTDPSTTEDKYLTVSFTNKEYVPKVFPQKFLSTIPYIGYLQVAVKSVEGLIIIGLVVLFLIILFIISELWKKDDSYDDDTERDTERGYVKSEKELRKEEKIREKKFREEEDEIRREEKRGRKQKKAPVKTVHTGGFVDEIEEDDDDDDDYDDEDFREIPDVSPEREAHELLKQEVAAAATADETLDEIKKKRRTGRKNVKNAVEEAAKETSSLDETEEFPEEAGDSDMTPEDFDSSEDLSDTEPSDDENGEPAGDEEEVFGDEDGEEADADGGDEEKPQPVKRAIPSYTAEELSSIAREEGDEPDVVRDDITNVTILDYSDLI